MTHMIQCKIMVTHAYYCQNVIKYSFRTSDCFLWINTHKSWYVKHPQQDVLTHIVSNLKRDSQLCVSRQNVMRGQDHHCTNWFICFGSLNRKQNYFKKNLYYIKLTNGYCSYLLQLQMFSFVYCYKHALLTNGDIQVNFDKLEFSCLSIHF